MSDRILKQMQEDAKKRKAEIATNNNKVLQVPNHLDCKEKIVYQEIVEHMKESIKYRLTMSDKELIWQYCFLKIMRDNAYVKWNENPERYIRIVIGIAVDGKTPKVVIKENEHYKILMDSSKQIEKILKDLKLTPEFREKE